MIKITGCTRNIIEYVGLTEEEIAEFENQCYENLKRYSAKVLASGKTIPNKKKAYISGKITGAPNLNKHKFDAGEAKVIELGHIPVNPHKLDHSANVFQKWFMYMRVCLEALMGCDLVVALDDWEHSRGAIAEIWTAEWVKIPVFDLKTMQPVKLSWWIKVKLILKLI